MSGGVMRDGKNLVWRSLLFVPAHVERFVEKAHTRGADGLILDLEDSVPAAEKGRARAGLARAAAKLKRGGTAVLVRVNAPLALAVPDIAAAIGPDVDGIVLTKIRGAEHVLLIEEHVAACEREAGLAEGHTWLYPLIETPEALPHAMAIARASPRVVALSLGPEDFATALDAEPTEDVLRLPQHLIVHAARAAGVMPLGLLDTLADYADPRAFLDLARRSRSAGFEGALCINPAQVAPLNEAFTPSEAQVARARDVIAAAATAAADGRGAATLDGRMIDAPVVRRAERLVARAEAIFSRGQPRQSLGP